MAFKHNNWPADYPKPHAPLPLLTLSAPPETDLWRKPPEHDVFNSPFLYHSLLLSSFRQARVSISADWRTLYDQGGLCLVLPQQSGKNKWVKTGIEFYHGAPNVSAVACDRWSDWSLSPLPSGDAAGVTVAMEREVLDGKPTSVLLVYVMDGSARRHIREVTWVFEDAAKEGRECWVGVYAAKPTRDKDDKEKMLEVSFRDLEVTTF